jgi:hypothetical protein
MTPREVVLANIACQADGRIAYNFTPDAEGTPRRQDLIGCAIDHGIELRRWVEDGVEYYDDIWGNLWHRFAHMSQGGEVLEPILEDWSDLDNLELPALDKPECYDLARERVAANPDLFRVGWMPWVFAACRYMRKMDVYFTDLLLERERIDVLHDRVTSLLERVIDRYGEAGVDAIMFCEDLGVQDRTLMGPPMWREIFRPLYERLTARAHEYGMKVIQHSCGYNWALVDDLCEAGIDCLQFDQPGIYDQPALAEKLRGHGVGLFSPVDIQKVLPTGDREFIEGETKRLVETFRGGLIAKDYPDLHGIGVEPEWDMWAYETFCRVGDPNNEYNAQHAG